MDGKTSTTAGLLEVSRPKVEFPSGSQPFSFRISLCNNSDHYVAFQLDLARMGLYRCQRQSGAIWPGYKYWLTITRDASRVQQDLMLLKKKIESLRVEVGFKKDLIKGVDVQKKVIDYLQDDQQDQLLDGEIRLYTFVLTPNNVFTRKDYKHFICEIDLPVVYASTSIISKLSSIPGRLFSSETTSERRKRKMMKNRNTTTIHIGNYLEINPGQILFPFELNRDISSSVMVSNHASEDTLVLTIEADINNGDCKYIVTPYFAVLQPKTTCEIIFTMQAQETAPSNLDCNDIFSMRITSLLSTDIRRFKNVHSVTLELVHDRLPPRPSTSLIPQGSHEEGSSTTPTPTPTPTRQELIMNLSRIFKQKSSAWTTQPEPQDEDDEDEDKDDEDDEDEDEDEDDAV